MEESDGRLVDEHGHKLSDREVLEAIGDEIYDETYRGACKQYKAGNALIKGGVAGMIAGSAISLTSLVLSLTGEIVINPETYEVKQVDPSTAIGLIGVGSGLYVSMLGAVVLSAGIPLKTIGYKRLSWVAENYNESQDRRNYSLRFGAGKYGTGLVVNF